MLVRVARETCCDVSVVLRAPYARTLWTYLHVLQAERTEELRQRGRELRLAGLVTLAFHEPKRLSDEHTKLRSDAGLLPSADQTRAEALDLMQAIANADALGAWVPLRGDA